LASYPLFPDHPSCHTPPLVSGADFPFFSPGVSRRLFTSKERATALPSFISALPYRFFFLDFFSIYNTFHLPINVFAESPFFPPPQKESKGERCFLAFKRFFPPRQVSIFAPFARMVISERSPPRLLQDLPPKYQKLLEPYPFLTPELPLFQWRQAADLSSAESLFAPPRANCSQRKSGFSCPSKSPLLAP